MSKTIVEIFKINTDLNPEKSIYAYSVKVDETFISPEYSKRPFWIFSKCQKYKYAKAKILYA